MVESIARVRHIRVTPQKARRVVALIKGKQAEEALAILKFAQQGASEPIYKLVASAIANARVKADKDGEYLDEQDLYVKNAYVCTLLVLNCHYNIFKLGLFPNP